MHNYAIHHSGIFKDYKAGKKIQTHLHHGPHAEGAQRVKTKFSQINKTE